MKKLKGETVLDRLFIRSQDEVQQTISELYKDESLQVL